jgi:hypothetical protein
MIETEEIVKYVTAFLGIVVAALLAHGFLGDRRARQADADLERMKDTIGRLEQNAKRTEESPRATPVAIAMARQGRRDEAAQAPEDADKQPADTPERSSAAEAAPSLDDQKAYLQASFSDQAPDADWSRTATKQLHEMFEPLASNDTSLRSVDCRSTLCRVELTHTTEAEYRSFMTTVMSGAMRDWKGPGGGGMLGTEPNGAVTTVLFLAREGAELPVLN